MSDPDCLGAMFGAEEPVYKGSGWTAVRDVVAREPEEDNDHWVEQTAVLYPQADNANEVLREVQVDVGEVRRSRRSRWTPRTPARCGSSATSPRSDGLITQMATQEDADGWGCQHALAVVSQS